MVNNKFEEAIEELLKIHKDMPDLRLGEILQGSVDHEGMRNNVNLFDVSNKRLVKAMKEHYDNEKQKRVKAELRKKHIKKNKEIKEEKFII